MLCAPSFNEKLFKKGQTVAVALSGGEDSVCLFHLLLGSAERLGIKVKVVNVDHGIRGEVSARDSEFVRRLCEKNGVELFFKKVDSLHYSATFGVSVEEAARILRYRVFDEAIAIGFCDVVATAHHLSDNAETVLLNLLRGSANLNGISKVSKSGKIVRPLLSVSKAEISRFVEKNALEFVTDETNFKDNYTRNFLRLNVFPLLKEKFPKAEESICRYAEISSAESEYLNSLAERFTQKRGDEISIDLSAPAVLFSRAGASAMKSLGIVKDYEKRHIDLLFSLKGEKNGATIDLPQGVKAVKDYGKITLYKPAEKSFDEVPFKEGETEFNDKRIIIESAEEVLAGDGSLYFDGDKIPKKATLRTRREGDTFLKFGGGRKKLKDYLIDKKIPSRERDSLVLIADGSEILAILGIEISESIKVDKSTEKVLKCNIYSVGEDK